MRNNFLEAANLAFAMRNHFNFPTLALSVARIHAEQIAGEQRRFIAAGTGANFQENIALVVGIFGDEQFLQIEL